MNALTEKFKNVLYAILPVTIIVTILHFTVTPFSPVVLFRFYLGAVLISGGLTLFLTGVDLGVEPIGQQMGREMARSNRLWVIVMASLVLGFFISIAEPALHVLAAQVDLVTDGAISKTSLIVIVSGGIAALLVLGVLRIVYNLPLYRILTVLYALIFILVIFTSDIFTAIAFDASGATTGAFAVPFIFALSLGISAMKRDSKASEKDSFGMVSIVSAGVILMVLLTSLIRQSEVADGVLDLNAGADGSLLAPFARQLPVTAFESLIALLPLIILFYTFQIIRFKLPRNRMRVISIGLAYSLIGLILFLLGVQAGFMQLGIELGQKLAGGYSRWLLVSLSFVLGLVTILTEPAVYVLTKQIEEVTSGSIHRRLVLGALALGVGLAVALSALRVVITGLQLWHYLVPGYLLAVGLSYIVPKLFVGIAFDSGGVASGPMTGTFILAFIQGSADAVEGANVLIDGFGMIAMVAMMPIITLQILGFIYKIKTVKRGIDT